MTEFITATPAIPDRDGERMVDTKSRNEYEALQDVAANEHVKGKPYSGSAEALALKQAFVLGANTSLQWEGNTIQLVKAMIEGRKWGLRQRSSRRLVAVGRKAAAFHTKEITYDLNRPHVVEAAGLPQWEPQSDPSEKFPKPDHDLIRKQRIEDEL